MRKSIRHWHNDVLAMHQSIMFDTLIHKHNIISDSVKSFVFEYEDGIQLQAPLRGYIAFKESDGRKQKYFIEEQFFDKLPIRVDKYEELYMKESTTKKAIVLRPLDPTPFKINPEQMFDNMHTFIDDFTPFTHTHPREWTLLKICAIMGYVGKMFLGISSLSEFGKSGIFTVLHGITQKSLVFQPRSDAGILIRINEDGNMVFDEVHECDSKTKKVMENFTLQVTANIPVYFNGAIKANNLKQRYDVIDQSITYLYNVYSYYKTPDNEFFDFIFSNNKAVDSRLLKLKFDGTLTERFDKDFDIVKVAEDYKMHYIMIAKQLLWLKDLKHTHKYVRRYAFESDIGLRGRRKLIYDELTWMIDMYAQSLEEYIIYIGVLDNAITGYREMVGDKAYHQQKTITGEVN